MASVYNLDSAILVEIKLERVLCQHRKDMGAEL